MTRAERLANWAWQEVKANRAQGALDALREAARLSGRQPPYLKALAVGLAKAGHSEMAVSTLEELVVKTPIDVEAWCMLGELSIERADFATAARALAICVRLDPNNEHPAGLRARALVRKTDQTLRR